MITEENVYNVNHVTCYSTQQHLLISTQHKVQLRLMGICFAGIWSLTKVLDKVKL